MEATQEIMKRIWDFGF